jgi:D-amino-acid oxidase
MRVAIIGAGVSGLTCARVLAKRGHECTLFAELRPQEQTTSAVAAAIWYPYDAEPQDLMIVWAFLTYGRLIHIARDPRSGVSLTDFHLLSLSESIDIPRWTEAIGYRRLTRGELRPPFLSGYVIRVPKMETPRYLPYLAEGLEIKRGHLEHLEDVGPGFDVLVNCTGMGARELVGDTRLAGHKGQVLVVPKSARQYAMVCVDPLMYVIPRDGDCVLGGINVDEGQPWPERSEATIVERCRAAGFDESCAYTDAPIAERPYRKGGVRVEAGVAADGRLVIHNYGHGGCGLSLSWGCAEKVAQLAESLA